MSDGLPNLPSVGAPDQPSMQANRVARTSPSGDWRKGQRSFRDLLKGRDDKGQGEGLPSEESTGEPRDHLDDPTDATQAKDIRLGQRLDYQA